MYFNTNSFLCSGVLRSTDLNTKKEYTIKFLLNTHTNQKSFLLSYNNKKRSKGLYCQSSIFVPSISNQSMIWRKNLVALCQSNSCIGRVRQEEKIANYEKPVFCCKTFALGKKKNLVYSNINRNTTTILRSKATLSGEVFKESCIDIFHTHFEQVGFSLDYTSFFLSSTLRKTQSFACLGNIYPYFKMKGQNVLFSVKKRKVKQHDYPQRGKTKQNIFKDFVLKQTQFSPLGYFFFDRGNRFIEANTNLDKRKFYGTDRGGFALKDRSKKHSISLNKKIGDYVSSGDKIGHLLSNKSFLLLQEKANLTTKINKNKSEWDNRTRHVVPRRALLPCPVPPGPMGCTSTCLSTSLCRAPSGQVGAQGRAGARQGQEGVRRGKLIFKETRRGNLLYQSRIKNETLCVLTNLLALSAPLRSKKVGKAFDRPFANRKLSYKSFKASCPCLKGFAKAKPLGVSAQGKKRQERSSSCCTPARPLRRSVKGAVGARTAHKKISSAVPRRDKQIPAKIFVHQCPITLLAPSPIPVRGVLGHDKGNKISKRAYKCSVPLAPTGKGKGKKISTHGKSKDKRFGEHPVILNSSGRVITISKTQIILQKTQPVLFYNSANIHVKQREWVKKGSPILTLTHQTLITGDIVQGIPRIEQLFEAFTSPPSTLKDREKSTNKFKDVHDTLHSRVRDIFRKHWLKEVLPIAVRKSLEEIQYILVESIQKVYLSQGVLIADKHIEIIIRQIASKGQILDSGSTGLFVEEVLPIRHIENANLSTPGKKCLYVPAVVGLTAAALSSDSFISAASFQETTRVLSRDAVVGKSDFLRGLKEKVVIGDLISAGTGLDIYFIYTSMMTRPNNFKKSKLFALSPSVLGDR